jgi:hypothetical protein
LKHLFSALLTDRVDGAARAAVHVFLIFQKRNKIAVGIDGKVLLGA